MKYPVCEENRLGGILRKRIPVLEEYHVGGILWEESLEEKTMTTFLHY